MYQILKFIYIIESLVKPSFKQSEFALDRSPPMELAWKNILITAEVKASKIINEKKIKLLEKKVILNRLQGVMKAGRFTAILGPSGSGKTTLLNFLSGRLASQNLTVSGELFLNSTKINDLEKYNDQLAYVMQDDILLATFTPRGKNLFLIFFYFVEAFHFAANLKLKKSKQEKAKRVEQLITELGLSKCANTQIGNNIIRGISGGERKRTSIGVELLTNPSLIFLDEPTTGLDSSTALQVIHLLKRLALNGKTVVSTIHQPSSEIFNTFDRLMLLVRGNIIYQGQSFQSIEYFSQMGFQCLTNSNPADYFMKLMNAEGLLVEKIQQGVEDELQEEEIEEEFKERIKMFVQNYKSSSMIHDLEPQENTYIEPDSIQKVGWIRQFLYILQRTFRNEIRNPVDVRMKLIQTTVNAIMLLLVFSDLGTGFAGIQNRNGALFFLTGTCAQSSIQGTLATFSMDKPLFLRERINKFYSVSAYFLGRSLAEFPFQLVVPAIPVLMSYYVVKFNQTSISNFFTLNMIQMLTYWNGVSYGLFISIVISKVEVATALVPVLILPFMILGGFFLNQRDIPMIFIPLEYISMFKYGFQGSVINEYQNHVYYCYPQQPCDPIEMLSITIGLWWNCLILFGLGFILRFFAYIALHNISNPTKPKLRSINEGIEVKD